MGSRALTVGVGVAASGADVVLDLGLVHPSGMGGWRLDVEVDGDVIVAAEPRVGFTHRADEKLLEARDYRQGLALVGRHDWFASTSSEITYALAVEQALGIVPSAHTTWSRTLLAEIVRTQALLLLAGGALVADAAGVRDVTDAPVVRVADNSAPGHPSLVAGGRLALAHRERLLDLIEHASGERVHPMLIRIGGIAAPFDSAWLDVLDATTRMLRNDLPAIADALRSYAVPFAGAGILDRATALDLGASGPVGRASDVGLDVRTAAPYLAYADLAPLLHRSPTNTDGLVPAATGDVPARYEALLHDLAVALDLVDASTAGVRAHADGPVEVSLPKTVRVPEGTTVASVEGPVGLTSAAIVSRGDRSPWRVSLRTPSFAHMQAMARASVGARLEALPAVTMSFMFAPGDADR